MQADGLKLRVERKFVPEALSLDDALTLVRQHPALFRETYPPRCVNNLYFDTPDLRLYREHVQGVSHRTKIRIRWYGQFTGPVDRPAFEIKRRFGTTSGKEVFGFPPFSMNGQLPREAIVAARDCEKLAEAARLALNGLDVVLGNRYKRFYFLSADGTVRLTVDCDLQFCGFGEFGGLLREMQPAATQLIIELKYDPANADQAAFVAGQFPFRPTRCSKYVIGITQLFT
ncbi:MAG: polyphosphate polymerase domain-containing protein [Verrucomicrobiota bacterium]|nr:polyphosphate polymerase domain-containing protein [Verrucomicrobiota bacterium]